MAKSIHTAVLHYSTPPVIGGVEAVIKAHARQFIESGYPYTVITGRGDETALPEGAKLIRIPLMDSQHPLITEANTDLEEGKIPTNFDELASALEGVLKTQLRRFDHVIVHNIFTKHFNLPLTVALYRLLDSGQIHHCIAWCHDFTWTSPHSRPKVFEGYPWDLLRTYRVDVNYVTVSEARQKELAELFHCSPDSIRVVYNGVDPEPLLGLTEQGGQLVKRMDLFQNDIVLLMPVRITQAKNIEYAMQVVAQLKVSGIRPKLVVTGPPDPHDPQSLDYFHSLQELRGRLDIEQEVGFVFESGPDPSIPYQINLPVVGDLYRVCDLLFLPSHREGFGMPIIEAGLVGMPVISTQSIPAAREIGREDVIYLDDSEGADAAALKIISWAEKDPVHQLRRRVRTNYTWQAIFRREIEPLIQTGGVV